MPPTKLYAKLLVGFFNHQGAINAGPWGRLLYLNALTYSKQWMTDGVIPADKLLGLADPNDPDPNLTADTLCRPHVRLWKPHPLGWEIVNWLRHNKSARQVKRDQEKHAESQRKYASRRSTPDESDDESDDESLTGGTEKKKKKKCKGDKSPLQTPSDSAGGKTRSSVFTPPTVAEVAAYTTGRQADGAPAIDPEAFVAFYTSKGWRVGNQPMKDWKGAVITWEKRQRSEGVGLFKAPTKDAAAERALKKPA